MNPLEQAIADLRMELANHAKDTACAEGERCHKVQHLRNALALMYDAQRQMGLAGVSLHSVAHKRDLA